MSSLERHQTAAQCSPLIQAVHASLSGVLDLRLKELGRGWRATRDELSSGREELVRAIQDRSERLVDLPLAIEVWDQVAELLQSRPLPEAEPLALVHRDLTEDHLYVQQDRSGWRISGLIDFGDAAVGPAHLDWNDLWFHMLARDVQPMKAFLEAYGGSIETQSDLEECFALTVGSMGLLDWLTVHVPTERLESMTELAELRQALWPGELLVRE